MPQWSLQGCYRGKAHVLELGHHFRFLAAPDFDLRKTTLLSH
jgi:hypothetical protein